MNQTQARLYATTGSPSLRRSLLLAARTPQVPPSPSTNRRSTLTQPTQSSAAKSAPSRNLKQHVSKPTVEKKAPAKPPVRTVQQNVGKTTQVVNSRPVSARRNVTITQTKNVVNKKTTPPAVRKVDNHSNSPKSTKPKDTPKIQQKKVDSPKSIQKSPSPKRTEPVKKTIQRSDTFLKDEPTVLQKI